jgi:hypothetical protein
LTGFARKDMSFRPRNICWAAGRYKDNWNTVNRWPAQEALLCQWSLIAACFFQDREYFLGKKLYLVYDPVHDNST